MSKASFRASGTQQGLIENMQIMTGQKGDKLDKALTLREAASLGLVNLRRNSSGNVVPEIPSNPSDPVWSGVQTPHAPVDVSADGAFHTISITWDPPTYQGHSYAEILRAETDNPAQAVPIGETSANVYSDAVGKGFEAYYWVRFVNKNGLRGPFQSSSGLHAKTSPDVDEIIASATNFAIYNPAKPTEKEIIFGVTDDGKVAILEAVIKAATIQILHAEKITADYVKAGVSISAPVINGGSIAIGNNFAVTADGAMTAWSATLRYVTSLYGTFRYATIDQATIKNCVIEEDCDVRGTIYANKIVGDVISSGVVKIPSGIRLSSTGLTTVATLSAPGDRSHDAYLHCHGFHVRVNVKGGYYGGSDGNYVTGSCGGEIRLIDTNGVVVASMPFYVSEGSLTTHTTPICISGGFFAGKGVAVISVQVLIDYINARENSMAEVFVPEQSAIFSLIPKGSLLS